MLLKPLREDYLEYIKVPALLNFAWAASPMSSEGQREIRRASASTSRQVANGMQDAAEKVVVHQRRSGAHGLRQDGGETGETG